MRKTVLLLASTVAALMLTSGMAFADIIWVERTGTAENDKLVGSGDANDRIFVLPETTRYLVKGSVMSHTAIPERICSAEAATVLAAARAPITSEGCGDQTLGWRVVQAPT